MSAFKGWQSTAKNRLFARFPNINFIPSNFVLGFPNCIALFDPSYGLNTYTDAEQVTQWLDLIGGYKFQSSGIGVNPIYNLSDTNFGNNPSINLINPIANLISPVPIGLSSDFTILFAAYSQLFLSSNCLLRVSTLNTGPRIATGGTLSAMTGIGEYSSSAAALLASNIEDTAAHITAISNKNIIVDGVNVASGSCIPYGWAQLGSSSTGTNQSSLNGALGYLAFFNREFSSSDMIRLVNNLNSHIPTF